MACLYNPNSWSFFLGLVLYHFGKIRVQIKRIFYAQGIALDLANFPEVRTCLHNPNKCFFVLFRSPSFPLCKNLLLNLHSYFSSLVLFLDGNSLFLDGNPMCSQEKKSTSTLKVITLSWYCINIAHFRVQNGFYSLTFGSRSDSNNILRPLPRAHLNHHHGYCKKFFCTPISFPWTTHIRGYFIERVNSGLLCRSSLSD